MAPKSDDRNLMVELTAEGRIRPSVRAAEHLKEVGGVWRLVPEIGRMMLLERVGGFVLDIAEADKDRQVRLCGTFETSGELHNTLSMIAMAQRDGALHVSDGEVEKLFFFRRGVLLSARSSLPEDRLGNLLVRVGMLSAADRDACLPDVRAGQPLGNVLVARGIMTTPKVYEGLRRQSEEIFYSVLGWQVGAFYLVAPLDMTQVPAMLHLNTQELLMDGVRKLDEEGASPSRASGVWLRRTVPLSIDQLPEGGVVRLAEIYNDALRSLFRTLDTVTCDTLRPKIDEFVHERLPFQELFFDVTCSDDGSLTADSLAENIKRLPGPANIQNLQLGLSEVLFFALFAAGEEITPAMHQNIQNEVASALKKLPRPSGDDLSTVDIYEEDSVVVSAPILEDVGESAIDLDALSEFDEFEDTGVAAVAVPDSSPAPGPSPVVEAVGDGEFFDDFSIDGSGEIASAVEQVAAHAREGASRHKHPRARTPSGEWDRLLEDTDEVLDENDIELVEADS